MTGKNKSENVAGENQQTLRLYSDQSTSPRAAEHQEKRGGGGGCRTWLICNQSASPLSRVAISSTLSCSSVLFTERQRLAAPRTLIPRQHDQPRPELHTG